MRFSSKVLGAAIASITCVSTGQIQAQGLRTLEEVIVTAQKREQSLQEVNVAVSAFSEDRLNDAGIVSSQNLDLVTPGLTMTESVFVPQPVLRGISTSNRNPGDEASVPTFVDGIYQPWQYAAFFEYNNIERVEVLRGPQGTLFGRNATGGALNIVTRRPNTETSGEIGLSYDSYEKQKIDGYFTTGLTETLAFDIAGFWTDGGGYYDDIVTGESLGDHNDTHSVRTKLLYEPTERTEITFVYTFTNYDNNLGFVGQPLNGNSITAAPAAGLNALPTRPFEAAQNDARLTQEQNNAGLTIKQEFDGFYLESLTGYQDTEVDGWADIDATIIPAARFEPDMVSESFTQALHLISDKEEGVQWILGAFYMDDDSGYDPFIIQLGPNTNVLNNNVATTAYALFAEATFEFGAGLTLTTGARYSYEEKEFTSFLNDSFVYSASDDWDDISPRVVLGWQANESLNTYVSYSEAFKSGTYNTADAFSPAVDPEDLKAYEAGVKWDIHSGLRLNMAAFYYDHEDLQLTSRLESAASTSLLLNAAEVESYGFELELLYAPAEGVNIFAGYAYLSSEFKEFDGAVISTPNVVEGSPFIAGNTLTRGDLSGQTNIKSPEHSAFIGGSYTREAFGGNATFGTNIAYTDEHSFEPDARIMNPSRLNVNATASWSPANESYSITLFGSNLTDEEYFTSVISNPATDNVRYAPPRTYGAEVQFNF